MGENGTAALLAENAGPSAGAAPNSGGEEQQVRTLPVPDNLRRIYHGLVPRPNVTPHFIEEFVILESVEPFAVSYVENDLDEDITALPPDLDFTASPYSDKRPNPEQATSVTTAAGTELTLAPASSDNLAPVLPVLAPLPAPNAYETLIPASSSASHPPSSTPATADPTPSVSVHMQGHGPASQAPPLLRIKPPADWTVDEVAKLIEKLPGCAKYAGEFRFHRIDGEAMLLLKKRHLIKFMGIKLGPAVKIWALIKSVRKRLQ
ncbi:hypothetical protein V5799_032106 [Amblyomma americanum]|uniref:SAM domain-containing protein n=1 Tax=Amblyomma americanum TaxID=6943 RepID=A0AAQ4DS30_AMBAM